MQHQILNIKSLKEEQVGEEINFENLYISPDRKSISGTTSSFYQLIDGQTVRVENTQFGIANDFTISVERCKRQGWVDYMKKYPLYLANIDCDYESLINVNLNYIIYEGEYLYEDVVETVYDGVKLYSPLSTFTLPNFGKVMIDVSKKEIRVPTRYYIYDDKVTIDDVDYFNGIDFDLKNHLSKDTDGMYNDYLVIDGISNIVKYYSDDKFSDILKCKLSLNDDSVSIIDVNNIYCAEPYKYIVYNNKEYEVKQISDSNGLKDYIDVISTSYYYKSLDGRIMSFLTYNEAADSAKNNSIPSSLIFSKEIKTREFSLAIRKYPDYFYNNNIAYNFEENYSHIIDGTFNGDYSFFENLKISDNYNSSDYGSKLFMLNNGSIDASKGDEIDFVGKDKEKRIIEVRQHETGKGNYILIDGIVYEEIPNTHYSVKINNFNYRVNVNENKSIATLFLGDESVDVLTQFNENIILTSITQNVISGNDTVQKVYSDITPLGSYLIGNTIYDSDIFKKINGDLNGNASTYEYSAIEYDENVKGKLIIEDVIGTNMFLCTPLTSLFNESINSESAAEEVCSLLYSNFNNITFYFKNNIFGTEKRPEDFNLLRGYVKDGEFIHIYNVNSFIELPLQLNNMESNNLFQEENINEHFVNEEKENIINDSADNERDIYYPSEYVEGDNLCKLPVNLKTCSEIELNFHFRNRSGNGWDIVKDNGPDDFNTTGCSSYFVFDNPMYSGVTNEGDYDKICNASDLLCFLNFTDNDVFFQKEKLDKTFARLEFYDSPNPNNQSMLFYSTIFLDSANLYKKYIYGMDDALSMYLTVNQFDLVNGEYKSITPEVRDSIRVNTEVSTGDTIVNNTNEIVSVIDEEKRLSCRLNIKDKFNTNSSSDGLYLYMFKDYSTGFYERSIYLKVEFNHAGNGKTIPMSYPREFYCNNNQIDSLTLYSAEINNVEYELVNPYTVRLSDGKEYPIESQLEKSISKIKQGYQVKNSYYQEYIEIKVIYDSVNKKYCYYLPFNDNTCYDNGKMILNLFELKINNINGN